MDQPTVSDLMTPVRSMIDIASSLQAAARAMAEQNVGALVVGAGGRAGSGPTAVGVVTDRDLVVRGLAAGLADGAAVQQVMTGQIITADRTDPVVDAFEAMRAAGLDRIPVRDEATLVGSLCFGGLGTEQEPASAFADVCQV